MLSATVEDEHRTEHRTQRSAVAGTGRGNKFVLHPDDQPKVIRAIRRGTSEVSIARSLRINYRTWCRVKAEDEEIASVLAETRRMEEDELVTMLIDKARTGDTNAISFALKSRHGYRDHGTAPGGNDKRVAIQINLPGPTASLEDYQRMIAVEMPDA